MYRNVKPDHCPESLKSGFVRLRVVSDLDFSSSCLMKLKRLPYALRHPVIIFYPVPHQKEASVIGLDLRSTTEPLSVPSCDKLQHFEIWLEVQNMFDRDRAAALL